MHFLGLVIKELAKELYGIIRGEHRGVIHGNDVGTSMGSGTRGNGVGGEDAKNSSLLAFNVLSIVWVCEVFSVLR